jgi:phage terminase large subunit-like protein
MPWQRQVVDVAFELDDDGTYHYDEVVLTVPRQSGKTALVMAVAVHRLVSVPRTLGRQRLTYTAQQRQKAKLKLERDFAEVLRDAKPAFREITHIRNKPQRPVEWKLSLNNGAENIQFGRGNFWQIDAPSRTGAHGDTLDVGVIDEAFAHGDNTIEAGLSPSMITRTNKQLIILSTAGDRKSAYLWRKTLAGRTACGTGKHGRTAYFEWSAEDDAEPGDPATWESCSPALGYTITLRALEGEWEKAQRDGQTGIDQFRRSYLNQWPEIPVLADLEAGWRVISRDWWILCEDPAHQPAGRLAFAVDVDTNARGEEWCSIGMSDGIHLELVTPADIGPGTSWVVPLAVARQDRFDELLIDPAGPAGKLIGPLEEVGIKVRKLTAQERTQASMHLIDRVGEGKVRHLAQAPLTRAAAGVVASDVGDGAIRFSRRLSPDDISPLNAVAYACWGAQSLSGEADFFTI